MRKYKGILRLKLVLLFFKQHLYRIYLMHIAQVFLINFLRQKASSTFDNKKNTACISKSTLQMKLMAMILS